MKKTLCFIVIFFLSASSIIAQSLEKKPATCCKTTSLRKVNLPAPKIMEGIGKSVLKITTKSDSAQLYFNQGLSLIHDFWEFEAYRAFEYAAKLDSTAAMCYWGMYFSIALVDKIRESDKLKALAMAKKFKKKASDHEQLYIQAIIMEDSLKADPLKSGEAYIQEMENLIHRYPDDVEAKLILWYSLDNGYDVSKNPIKGTMYSEQMLRNLLYTHPEHHGVNHYWLHQMEDCCPQEAMKSAEKLPLLAPNSGHIVHMPGHIYYRIGDYKKARESFLASMKVDSIYLHKSKVDRIDNWNYIHNLNYLIANDAEEGRYKEAIKIQEKMIHDFPLTRDTSLLTEKSSNYAHLFNLDVFQSVELELRFGNWGKAAERLSFMQDKDLPMKGNKKNLTSVISRRHLLLAFSLGMNALEKGKINLAKQYSYELDGNLWRYLKQQKVTYPRASEQFYNAQSYELRGAIAIAEGDTANGFKFLRQALEEEKLIGYREPPLYFRPVRLMLIDAYLKTKQWNKAREVCEELLKIMPNNGHALYRIALSYEEEGKKELARKAYNHFLSIWSSADADLKEVKKAKESI